MGLPPPRQTGRSGAPAEVCAAPARGAPADGRGAGERNRFGSAATTWQNTANPNSPWYVSYSSANGSNVDMLDMTGSALGTGRLPQEDAYDHVYVFTTLALRHNISSLGVSWYSGTGTPTSTQVDAWSVWMEELGHIQNISHHVVAGHETHTTHRHTMEGSTVVGNTTKRTPLAHEIQHACNPYRRSHSTC